MTPTCTPVAFCSARWQASAACLPSISGAMPAAIATSSAADELSPEPGGMFDATFTVCGATPQLLADRPHVRQAPVDVAVDRPVLGGMPLVSVKRSTAAGSTTPPR